MQRKREKILVLVPFRVYPPIAGGQMRVYYLYKALSRWFDITLLTFSHPGMSKSTVELSEGFKEIRVPKSIEHLKQEIKLSEQIGLNIGDIALCELFQLSNEYIEEAIQEIQDSNIIVASHPFVYPIIKNIVNDSKIIWYDAHNVEYLLKSSMLPKTSNSEKLLKNLFEVEKECCNSSEIIFTCSNEDLMNFTNLYKVGREKFILAPNGVDINGIEFIPYCSRKGELRRPSAVFIGSAHPPNLNAVEYIVSLAKELPEMDFYIVGGCGNIISEKNITITTNVKVTGMVSNIEKRGILGKVDIALNPIPYGSGTNLKMLEYFACGIPVISNDVGVRGLNINDQKYCIVSKWDEFLINIKELLKNDRKKQMISQNAREYVESHYSWEVISKNIVDKLRGKNIAIPEKRKVKKNKSIYFSPSLEEYLKEISVEKNIFLWGAGQGGRTVLEIFRKNNIKVSGFLDMDSNKIGTKLEGISIFSPLVLNDPHLAPFIVISSTFSHEIKLTLLEMGFKEKKDFVIQDLGVPFLSFD